MFFNKLFNYIAIMPSGAIDVKPDRVITQRPVQMPQNFQESVSVAFCRANHPIATQKRNNPTRYVQAFLMLTRRQNTKPDTLFGPAATKTGMKCKACFILKSDRLLWPQIAEFFLTFSRTFEHPPTLPECMSNQRVLAGIPDNASTFEPVALSDLCQSVSSGEQLQLDRPIAPGLSQSPAESSLNERPKPFESYSPVSLDAQSAAWVLKTPALLHLHRVTNDSGSFALSLKRRLSNMAVVLQEQVARQRSLALSMLRESCRPTLTDFLSLLPNALNLMWGFSCFNISTKNLKCHFI